MVNYLFQQYTLEYLRDGIIIYENFSFWFDLLILGTILGYLFSWGAVKARIGKTEKQQNFFGNFIGWVVAFFVVGGIHRQGRNFFELYPYLLLILFFLLGIVLWRLFESFFGRNHRMLAILLAAAISLLFFSWSLSPLGVSETYEDPIKIILYAAVSLLHLIIAIVGFGSLIWLAGKIATKRSAPTFDFETPKEKVKSSVSSIKKSFKDLERKFNDVDSSIDNFENVVNNASNFFSKVKEFLNDLNANLSTICDYLEKRNPFDSTLKTALTNWAVQTQNLTERSKNHLTFVSNALENTKSRIQKIIENATDFSVKEREINEQLDNLSNSLQDFYQFLNSVPDKEEHSTLMKRYQALSGQISLLRKQQETLSNYDREIKNIQGKMRSIDLSHKLDLLADFKNDMKDFLDEITSSLQKTERESAKEIRIVIENLTTSQSNINDCVKKIEGINYFFGETVDLINGLTTSLSTLQSYVSKSENILEGFNEKFEELLSETKSLEKDISSLRGIITPTKKVEQLIEKLKTQRDLLRKTFNSLASLIFDFNAKVQREEWLSQEKAKKLKAERSTAKRLKAKRLTTKKLRDLANFISEFKQKIDNFDGEIALAKDITKGVNECLKGLKNNTELKSALTELGKIQKRIIEHFNYFNNVRVEISDLFEGCLNTKRNVNWTKIREISLFRDFAGKFEEFNKILEELEELELRIEKEIK